MQEIKKYTITQLVEKLGDAIIKDNKDLSNLVIIGILTRGYPLATRIAAYILKQTGKNIPLGKLDITLYRDDLENSQNVLSLKETLIPDDIENKPVILVDDVLYRGRTVRAALEHILAYGRPSYIRLAVLIDRGHKELPISANYIGHSINTQQDDIIKVRLSEVDGIDNIELL